MPKQFKGVTTEATSPGSDTLLLTQLTTTGEPSAKMRLDEMFKGMLIRRSTSGAITAASTQTQGQQPLTNDINIVTTVGTTNDVVTLPSAEKGLEVRVLNRGANTLQVFPASGDAIDGGSVNAADTIATNTHVTYVATDATNWYSIVGA